MGRSGIYKTDVLKARKRLLSDGRRVTLDALREELGNTGSKGTIHRYLKEIEAEEGGGELNISQALQKLVADLAERLSLDAEEVLEKERETHAQALAAQQAIITARDAEILALSGRVTQISGQLAGAQQQLAEINQAYQLENVARAELAQEVRDMTAQRTEDAAHRRLAENAARDARQALEHFREAAREQRAAEQRQHGQQVQFLQAELRTANNLVREGQERQAQLNTRLADLTHELAAARRDAHTADQQRVQQAGVAQQAETALIEARAALQALQETQRQLQQAHAVLQGKAEAQQALLSDLQTRLGPVARPEILDKRSIVQSEIAQSQAENTE